jgi:hypothetical protein
VAVVTTPLPETLAVEPGGEVTTSVRVRNRSGVIDEFTFAVLGEPEGWTDVEPPSLSLFPNGEGLVELRFQPPRAPRTAPGLVPYGLLVGSANDDDASVVEEGALVLSAFRQPAVELSPRTSRGRFSGKHRLAVDNFGNAATTVTFTTEDSENALRINCGPDPLIVGPATVGFARVKVRPNRRFLTGPDRVYPFKVKALVDETEPIEVDGLHMQHAILPRLVLPLAFLLAAALILWAIFKPEANSSAQELQAAQAQEQQQEQAAAAAALVHKDAEKARRQAAAAAAVVHKDAEKARKQAAAAAAQVRKDTKQAAKSATAATSAASEAVIVAERAAKDAGAAKAAATQPFGGAPTGMRLALRCPPTCTTALLIPADNTLYAADVLLSNPGGDKGTLRLTLAGKPLLVEGLDSFRTLEYAPSTPLLLSGGQPLALSVACANPAGTPCTPSAYVGGFSPPQPPNPAGPNGAPLSQRLNLRCPPTCTASMKVPSGATAVELTDVLFQNPANDKGTVTFAAAGKTILVEGLDSFRDLPIAFTAPIVLAAGKKATLSVACANAKGKSCTPGLLLGGVFHKPPPKK